MLHQQLIDILYIRTFVPAVNKCNDCYGLGMDLFSVKLFIKGCHIYARIRRILIIIIREVLVCHVGTLNLQNPTWAQ